MNLCMDFMQRLGRAKSPSNFMNTYRSFNPPRRYSPTRFERESRQLSRGRVALEIAALFFVLAFVVGLVAVP